MKLTADALDLNWREVEERLLRFIGDYSKKSGLKGAVLGVSGGVDSSTAAAITARALGGRNLLGLLLPEEETRTVQDIKHALLVAEKFGFEAVTINITPTLKTFYETVQGFDVSDKLCKGNAKARTRMVYIYYYANRLRRLVIGSSDKSETMLGYFTKWGDVAGDLHPLMDLYKTQVRRLALHIGIPEEIVAKPPSPALWPNQRAEDELGMPYEQLDLVLCGLEHFMKPIDIAEQLNLGQDAVEEIKRKWLSAEHKRRMLLTAKLEYRTIGADFRLPRDPL